MKKLSSKIKEYRILGICIILLAGFVALACFSGAWPSSDFAAQILAALAGAVVAAIITLFLLQGQTESEAKKDKDSKVFEEKLNIYQEFLQKLCDVIEDREITPEEAIQLQFEVAKLSIHTKNENLKKISEAVSKICDKLLSRKRICDSVVTEKNESSKESSPMVNDLLDNLLTIVDCFRNELYSDMEQFGDKEGIREYIIDKFGIFNDLLNSKGIANILETSSNKEIKEIDLEVWKKETLNNIEIRYTQKQGHFSIGVAWENDGWYFWLSTDEQDDARNIYQHVKSRFGGRFSQYSCWWKYLKEEYVSIPQDEFMTRLNNDSDLQTYVENVIRNLCTYADNLQKLYDDIYYSLNIDEIAKNKGYTWFWYDRTLVIDFGENADRPFIDINLIDIDVYCIAVSRRNGAVITSSDSDILQKIGLTLDKKDGRYKIDQLSKTDVKKYVNIINQNILAMLK